MEMTKVRHIRARRIGSALAIAALVLGGCGDDDDGSSSSAPAEIDVVGIEFAFVGLPERVEAGTVLNFRNDSSVEVHEIVAMRLVDGEERPLDVLFELPDEEVDALFAGPPALVTVAAPGEIGTIVLGDGSLTEPGRYVIICGIPTGADPDEFMAAANAPDAGEAGPPDVEGGPPHFVHGMIAELWVDPAA